MHQLYTSTLKTSKGKSPLYSCFEPSDTMKYFSRLSKVIQTDKQDLLRLMQDSPLHWSPTPKEQKCNISATVKLWDFSMGKPKRFCESLGPMQVKRQGIYKVKGRQQFFCCEAKYQLPKNKFEKDTEKLFSPPWEGVPKEILSR